MPSSAEEEGKRDMIQLDLFNDGITSVTLENFNVNKNKFDWFKESTHLGIEYENEIYKYYDIEYDFENPSLYLANPLNATITGKTTFHCMKILFDDGDSVLIVYRSLEFMKKRIHVFDIPISINKNDIPDETQCVFRPARLFYIRKHNVSIQKSTITY